MVTLEQSSTTTGSFVLVIEATGIGVSTLPSEAVIFNTPAPTLPKPTSEAVDQWVQYAQGSHDCFYLGLQEIDEKMKDASPANKVRYLYLKSILKDPYDKRDHIDM